MEEIAEGALKGLLRLVSVVVRSLMWLIWELCFEVIAWYVGWPICRAISFGKLPQKAITDHEQASNFTNFTVSMVGLVSLVGLAILIAKLVGSG
ncbi:hypothetical protein [Microbulbifer sp. THAF38]|uniref:hypothetical protein n=1 Tax=Microbulbifer sp. THAF38 TaxID=2587856 RepID=UPI0012685B52|nr:hypothetical protein [Microbulbifer sp. THAF38]QFT54434.1 hypothetical protein FIU95_07685 [Microbulbifer sp. THAF38]QFT54442.1 hypothetical protein FIU95_07735 [Microbulbifer sp. THAF38]